MFLMIWHVQKVKLDENLSSLLQNWRKRWFLLKDRQLKYARGVSLIFIFH